MAGGGPSITDHGGSILTGIGDGESSVIRSGSRPI
jgi:hypothetical protein